jgi:serine/threonine-protein kinase
MVMEFVDGVTLEQKLKDGPLPVLQALDAASQVLSALEYAHAQGVIHRDIKPANMIVTKAGVVKLMDFGIAKAATDHKLTMTGTTMGSLYYMSPEQIQGVATLDGRADLYSVGVTLYQLVTGKRPFDGDSQYAIMAAHLEKTPVPPVTLDPSLPQALNDLILMSVAKDPNARFQTAGAFRNALAAVAATLKAPTQPAFAAAPLPQSPTAPPTPARAPFATTNPPVPPAVPPPMMAAAPVAGSMPPPAVAARPRSHRGLWMALGGIAVAAAIVCVIEFGPWKGAIADSVKHLTAANAPAQPPAAQPVSQAEPAPQQPQEAAPQQPAPQEPAPPQPAPAAKPAAAPAPAAQPPVAQRAQPQPVPPQPRAQPQPPAPQPQPQAQQPPPQPERQASAEPEPAATKAPTRREMTQARERVVKLEVRASAIRDSLKSLKRSQQASGMSLNARFTQPEGLMNAYLQSANEALNEGDLPAAREYAGKAERQIEILERLLNL